MDVVAMVAGGGLCADGPTARGSHGDWRKGLCNRCWGCGMSRAYRVDSVERAPIESCKGSWLWNLSINKKLPAKRWRSVARADETHWRAASLRRLLASMQLCLAALQKQQTNTRSANLAHCHAWAGPRRILTPCLRKCSSCCPGVASLRKSSAQYRPSAIDVPHARCGWQIFTAPLSDMVARVY